MSPGRRRAGEGHYDPWLLALQAPTFPSPNYARDAASRTMVLDRSANGPDGVVHMSPADSLAASATLMFDRTSLSALEAFLTVGS